MARTLSTPNLHLCKSDAKRLLSELHSGDAAEARNAAERLRAIPPFAEASVADILAARGDMQLKHAQWAVAVEQGYPDWKSLKDAADFVWYPRDSAFLNSWFARYADARSYLEIRGGYLLTNKGKYFVCVPAYIASLGLDPDDPRWEAIGHDVARPRDERACEELTKLAETAAKKPRPKSRAPDPTTLPRWIKRR